MMLMLPSSSTYLSFSSSSCNAALIRKECRLLGASRLTISIRRRNDAVSCEAADSSSWTAPIVAETKEKDAGGGVGKSAADRLRQGSLTEDGLSYKEKFIVRCYEWGTVMVPLATHSCEAYVVRHMSDVVEVESWFESKGEIGIRRDWILKDYATHEVLGRATSKYVMMNQHTRRLEKVSDDVRKEYLGFCPREPRLAFPEEKNGSLKKIAKLEDVAQYSRQGLVPRRADLDMNQHVNNVAYIGWFLEVGKVELLCIFILRFSKRHGLFVSADSAVRLEFPCYLSIPQEIIDTHELETITLDYRRECQQHDVVDSHTSPEPVEDTKVSELNGSNGTAAAAAEGKEDYCQFLHLLRLSGDGLEINRGRTEWRKKPTRHANHSV
ncbi:hypothetical protein RHGRI_002734 [Rhododendron griersonianum]|uniref:Acyl-[acyl-carrier-protein] hydrolase n=1 Tax=Rhododendron griersonianum TaxID=479676 RepID=A0AAV6LSK9_9ERIC|nr:hypothetical protein RHGRI_002734 [Rhododendron griersonianum]